MPIVGAGAVIGAHSVLHPQTYIGPEAVIGAHALIYPGVRIGARVIIGDRCIIHFNASIGADGFSFVTPQRGSVRKRKGDRHGGLGKCRIGADRQSRERSYRR